MPKSLRVPCVDCTTTAIKFVRFVPRVFIVRGKNRVRCSTEPLPTTNWCWTRSGLSSNGLFHQKANYCSNQSAGKGEFSEKSFFSWRPWSDQFRRTTLDFLMWCLTIMTRISTWVATCSGWLVIFKTAFSLFLISLIWDFGMAFKVSFCTGFVTLWSLVWISLVGSILRLEDIFWWHGGWQKFQL